MTINSTDFENGLNKAKKSMKGFDVSVGSLTKSFAKFAGGLGVAVSVSSTFIKNIKSIETVSDGVDRSMKVVDESIKSVFTTINTNSFKGFIDGLAEVIKNAKEAYNALDNLGTYLNFSSVEAARNQASQSEARYMIAAIKKGDIEGNVEFWENKLRQLQSEAEGIIDKEIKHYEKAVEASDKLLFSRFKGNEEKLQQFRERYTGTADKNELAQSRYEELNNQRKEIARLWGKNSTTNTVYKDFMSNYGDELSFLEIIVKREKDMSEINKLLIAQENKKNQLYNERRTNLKYLAGGNGSDATATATGGNTTVAAGAPAMSEAQVMQYLTRKMQNEILADDRAKDSVLIEIELLDEDIVEADTEALCQAVIKTREEMALLAQNTQMAMTAANYLGQAFVSMGNIADGTLGDVFNALGSIIGQITSTVSAMMTLAGAETVEGIADVFANQEGGAVTKLAVTAAALAGILGMISTAKSAFAGSYADGGIVGGTSYSGDRLWARVNSGEMILNRNQQAALFNGGGQVNFIIEGSQLKGVLENYDKMQNL